MTGDQKGQGRLALLWDSQVGVLGDGINLLVPWHFLGLRPLHVPRCKGPTLLCPDCGCLQGAGPSLWEGASCPLDRSSCPGVDAARSAGCMVSCRLTRLDWGRIWGNQVQGAFCASQGAEGWRSERGCLAFPALSLLAWSLGGRSRPGDTGLSSPELPSFPAPLRAEVPTVESRAGRNRAI